MNILLTTACNLDCDYCFAQSLRSRAGQREMTLQELDWLLSQLDPDVDEVRLMGGEPTLHSRYGDVMRLVKSSDFIATVFTNGTRPALRQTAPDLPDRVLLNLNDWQTYSAGQRAEILNNLSALGNRLGLGYTVTRSDFDLSTHRELILAHDLKPVIRLGLAQPVISGRNVFVADADLAAAHRAVADWATRLAADGIRLNFDCGFMRCHFTDRQIEQLIRASAALRFFCAPSLDVGPGLLAWRCYAFSAGPGLDLRQFRLLEEAREWFRQRDQYLAPGCDSCRDHGSGWCQGGCLARQAIQASPAPVAPANLK
jgi:hypothetical protein